MKTLIIAVSMWIYKKVKNYYKGKE